MSKGKTVGGTTTNLNTTEVRDLLHRISDGATGSTVPLSEVLRLCIRLGSLLGNEELIAWAKSEVMGYEKMKDLPPYRVLEAEVRADFHGPFGSAIKNTVVPVSFIEKGHRDVLCKSHMMQPVSELERLAGASNNGSNLLTSNWSGDAIAYYQQKELYSNGMVLAAAWRALSQAALAGISDTIRTRVLDFALRIEKELGLTGRASVADEVEKPAAKKVDQIVYAAIYGAGNVSLGNNGTLTQNVVNVQPGDMKALKAYLKEIGITDDLVEELEQALDEDGNSKTQPGPATQGWLGKIMIMMGKGSLSLATNTTGSLVAETIMRFLGLSQ